MLLLYHIFYNLSIPLKIIKASVSFYSARYLLILIEHLAFCFLVLIEESIYLTTKVATDTTESSDISDNDLVFEKSRVPYQWRCNTFSYTIGNFM